MAKRRRRKRKNRLMLFVLAILLFAGVFAVYRSDMVKKKLYPLKYSETVVTYANKYGVEKALVFAVIKAESGFDEKAKSNKNAYGLMQITEDTMDWLKTKVDDPSIDSVTTDELYDPEVSIHLGTYLLRYNLDKYGDLKTALCAYNAGNARTDQWLTDSRFSEDGHKIDTAAYKETEEYTLKVMKYKEEYEKLYFS